MTDGRSFVALLKHCAKQKDLNKGTALHAHIIRTGLLENNIYLVNSLINMYAKCGALAKAQQILDGFRDRNVVTWSTLIAGYIQQGHTKEALNCFYRMQDEGLSPDSFAFSCILKACSNIGAVDKGEKIHAEIIRQGLLGTDIVLGNALVDMYTKCGKIAKAQQVFDTLSFRDCVTWNALIVAYVHQENIVNALDCVDLMQHEGLCPNAITFTCILRVCSSLGAAKMGEAVLTVIVGHGFLENSIIVGTAAVDMFVKCGAVGKAQQVFDKLPFRNLTSWSALIGGYSQHGYCNEALNCFECMQQEGISPDAVTFISILKACSSIGAVEKGDELHAKIVKHSLLDKHFALGTALVDMYTKFGALAKAQQVANKLPVRDVITWNVLIVGYAKQECGKEVLNCFRQMKQEGLLPDIVTLACTLRACGILGAAKQGEELHDEIVKHGLLEHCFTLGNALVDMYVKCGELAKAQDVLEKLPVRSLISWSALIIGYVQHGHGEAALNCVDWMATDGLYPDAVLFVCILKACGSVGAIEKGEQMYLAIVGEGLLSHTEVGGALVDMYAKCGTIVKAWKVLENLAHRNIVCWNALISGYAQHGLAKEALYCVEQMQHEGFSPDAITFVCILNACNHAALIDEGLMLYAQMLNNGIIPNLEHQVCMVDLFGRAGDLRKTVLVMKKMPLLGYHRVWVALLGACLKWGNVKLGRYAFSHAIQLDEKDSASYICMGNIYASAGMQEEAHKIGAMRAARCGK